MALSFAAVLTGSGGQLGISFIRHTVNHLRDGASERHFRWSSLLAIFLCFF